MFNYRVIGVVSGVALLAAGCGGEDTAEGMLADGAHQTVVMDEFSYEPASLDVPAGSTITLTFRNDGAVDHEVMLGSSIADGGGYQTDLLARMQPEVLSGSGYSVSFSEPADMEGVAFFEGEGDHTHDDEPTSTTDPAQDHAHDGSEPADHHDDE
ncbi:MAG: cupredoxin domain-containing protein, partial [Acidimicrobiia bacterium]|nr:cupredoxin domain-containing protein [Acidimicrobiia bacterium]